MIFEAAHLLGIVPLLWLGGLGWYHERRDRAWWLLALSFAVGFLADTAAHVMPWQAPSFAYALFQSMIAAAVLVEGPTFWVVAGLLVASTAITGLIDDDLFGFTVAGLSIAVIVWRFRQMPNLLRLSLLIGFGGGVLAWWGYCLTPGWAGWLAFQGTRLASVALFCWAALTPGPRLRLA